MEQSERHGYWVIEWSDTWDPSLSDLLQLVPELVCGKRIAITSCDSGPYLPSSAETHAGWSRVETTSISREIGAVAELPAPGFDEWYVFDSVPHMVPMRNHVNRYGFSVLDDRAASISFWEQIGATQPLHALGAGAPRMFFVTRDRLCFERVQRLNLVA